MENQLSSGIPKDEVFFYEDALRQGRTVVIGTSTDDEVVEKGELSSSVTAPKALTLPAIDGGSACGMPRRNSMMVNS